MGKFVPRLDTSGMYQSRYYYSDNPFFQSGYSLPNCTCYAWGRFYEISNVKPSLPLGDGGDWYPDAIAAGIYKVGQTPQLGAVACYSMTGRAGHVAIVEEIKPNGDFVISQSNYTRPIAPYPPDTDGYFFTDVCDATSKKSAWLANFTFQGFIYNPEEPIPPTPPTPTPKKKKGMPLWMYIRYY